MNQQRANVRGAYRGGGRGRGGSRGGVQSGGYSSSSGPRGGVAGASNASLIYKGDQPARVDARIDSANELIPRLARLGVTKEHPPRPGYGTLGRVTTVRSNFFAMELTRDTFYEYVIDISPLSHSRKPTAHVKRRVLALFEKSDAALPYIHKIAHDGAQRLIAAERLPQPLEGVVKYSDDDNSVPEDAESYTVSVQFSRELATAPLKKFQEGDIANIDKAKEIDPLISALNLVMQREASQHGIRFGKNRYFFEDGERRPLGPNLHALMGYYVSVRPVFKQLMVNVNACMAAFYEPGKLSDALHAFESRSRGAIPQDFLAKVRISTNYRKYKCVRTISRIADTSARKQKFLCKEYGGKITVEEFFLKKHGIKLKEADTLPLIDIGSSEDNPVYVPAELCTVERGEPYFGKLGPNETTAMLRYASRKPAMNAKLIVEQGLSRLGYTSSTPVLDAFGVRVSGEMSVIPARELPPPKVTYAKGPLSVHGGSWNLRDVKFHRGAKAKNWVVLVVRDGVKGLSFDSPADSKLVTFLDNFANKCRSSGMDMAPKPSSVSATADLSLIQDQKRRPAAVANISQTIGKFGNMKNISFILVLLQTQDELIYSAIKRLCAVEFGVHSQCLYLGKALEENRQEQYFANVALKLNTKLGGVNHLLAKEATAWLRGKSTILIGVDVTHPSPKSLEGTPSIVGVVGSVDSDFVQFPASLRLQKSKREVIRENVLRDMIVERLQAYRQHSKVLPERMIVFRDGVSEGQYDDVLQYELSQIFQAFATVDPKNPKYRPVLSIVICGKRHHARFFATNSEHADKNGNTLPGTVVDKGVTSVADFDFYLQAHAGLQGSVKSTHYVVLYDESSLTADDVQQGVHTVSYLYARATKAVSLAPPAYYADIGCERGRDWIRDFLLANTKDDEASSGASVSTGKGADTGASPSAGRKKPTREEAENRVYAAAERAWGNGLHPNLRDSMFYL